MIVVSYADTSKGHVGYVYQATNFLYTGLSANRVDWTIKGQEHKHSKTISDGLTLDEIKELHGDDFYYTERSRKHRYILFHGSKTDKKVLRSKLKYEVLPYHMEGSWCPKGDGSELFRNYRIQSYLTIRNRFQS